MATWHLHDPNVLKAKYFHRCPNGKCDSTTRFISPSTTVSFM